MKLRTAANTQWWLAVVLFLLLSLLFSPFKIIDFVVDKTFDIVHRFVFWIGRKLLLHSDEYKSGIFKNPKVEDMSALDVWDIYQQDETDI